MNAREPTSPTPRIAAQANKWATPTAIVTLLAVFIGFQPMPFDPDLWFHLAGGELMVSTGAVPTADPFSFTRLNQPWTPHSWLFDVATFELWENVGPRAAEALMAVVFGAIILISFFILARASVHPLAVTIICLAIAIGAANSRGLRPQVLSLLFCNLVIGLCMVHQSCPSRRIVFAAAIIFLIWAQVHAGCVMGVAILGLWLAGRCIDAWWASGPSKQANTGGQAASGTHHNRVGAELRWLFGAMLAGAAVILMTPHAITLYQYVWLTMNLTCLKLTAEWQSPQLWPIASPDVFFYLLLGAVAVVVIRARRRPRWSSMILFGAMTVLAFSGVRHIPLMCIAAVPLLADVMGQLRGWHGSATLRSSEAAPWCGWRRVFDRLSPSPRGRFVAAQLIRTRATRKNRATNVPWQHEVTSIPLFNPLADVFCSSRFRSGIAVGLVLCFAGAWRFPSTVEQRYAAAEPVIGGKALAALGGEMNVFTTYNTGSYILWSSPRHLRVMVDSRADVYGDAIVHEATRARLGDDWERTFDEWDVTAAVVQRGDPLADILKNDKRWRTLAVDQSAITFIRWSSPGALAASTTSVNGRIPKFDGDSDAGGTGS